MTTSLLDNYLIMARYNRWMNQRLYAACEALPDAQRKADQGAFFKSIHHTLTHLVLADKMWLTRFAQPPSAARYRRSAVRHRHTPPVRRKPVPR